MACCAKSSALGGSGVGVGVGVGALTTELKNPGLFVVKVHFTYITLCVPSPTGLPYPSATLVVIATAFAVASFNILEFKETVGPSVQISATILSFFTSLSVHKAPGLFFIKLSKESITSPL